MSATIRLPYLATAALSGLLFGAGLYVSQMVDPMKVLRFLDQKDVKQLYHRVEKDSKNFGRLFVHFRWK